MRHVLLAPSPSFASSLRLTSIHLLLTLSFLAAAGASAQAQDYPWCANYTKGSTSCSFVTFEQCMADVAGIGGFCERNTQYHPATAPARPKPRTSSGAY